jgi:hypothetical protein
MVQHRYKRPRQNKGDFAFMVLIVCSGLHLVAAVWTRWDPNFPIAPEDFEVPIVVALEIFKHERGER